MRKLLGGKRYIHYLDWGDGITVYAYVKTYPIVYFIICQLHLKKAVWEKAERKMQITYIIYTLLHAQK